jgi:hypothetical protein
MWFTRLGRRLMPDPMISHKPTRILLLRRLQPSRGPDSLHAVVAHIPTGFALLDGDASRALSRRTRSRSNQLFRSTQLLAVKLDSFVCYEIVYIEFMRSRWKL